MFRLPSKPGRSAILLDQTGLEKWNDPGSSVPEHSEQGDLDALDRQVWRGGLAVVIRLATLLLVSVCGVIGCAGSGSSPVAGKKDWPLPLQNVNSRADEIIPLSGTTFQWGEVRCQLLGVKEADDMLVQKRSEDFARAWFKSVGNLIAVYNSPTPS
jgi:hypothetical protein